MSDVDDSVSDPGYRSRSQSRRARRQRQKGGPKAQAQASSMDAIPEDQQGAQTEAKTETPESKGMQPFEHIGPDETSMDGPVTYARAQRGEIPPREGNPDQKLGTAGGQEESKMMEQDGLKLRLELNLDVEVELKAKIYGDLTLALLA